MKGNTLLDNISKLNTFIHMSKANNLLAIYVEKITNGKSGTMKFVSDFDNFTLDLLYTSLQIMSNKDTITKAEYNKLDKKELSYYIKKVKGMDFFKRQVPTIKTEEHLINYLIKALANGEYTCNFNNTIKFDNGLIIDAEWTNNLARFLIASLNNNTNLSSDATCYYFNTVKVPVTPNTDVNAFVKDLKQYEYSVKRQDNKKLSFQNVKYLIDKLSVITDYDFKSLQEINSELEKNRFTLSVNKKNVTVTKETKMKLEKLLNEESDYRVTIEFIKDTLKCHNSASNINKRKRIETFEILRSLSYAYKSEMPIQTVREQFSIKENKSDLENALNIAAFYINYVYDETNLERHFNYAILNLENLKPSIIDYETPEYKSIIRNLSVLNKKVISINRRINKYLEESRNIPKNDLKFIEENASGFVRNCASLDKTVKETKILRARLDEIKDDNRHNANINKTKLKYIKEAIITGHYTYSKDNLLTFDCYSDEDYHHTFHLEITASDFKDILLSEENCNARINFYQI